MVSHPDKGKAKGIEMLGDGVEVVGAVSSWER